MLIHELMASAAKGAALISGTKDRPHLADRYRQREGGLLSAQELRRRVDQRRDRRPRAGV